MGKNNNILQCKWVCLALLHIMEQRKSSKKKLKWKRKFILFAHIIRDVANLAGFEITNRIHFRHKKSGRNSNDEQ